MGSIVTLTRDFKQTVVERVERDPDFVEALLDEAATLLLSGEADTAHLVLDLTGVRQSLGVVNKVSTA